MSARHYSCMKAGALAKWVLRPLLEGHLCLCAVLKREAPISAAELVRGLPEGAAVRVCQGKACSKHGSAGLMASLQEAGAPALSVTACKCLDKCKLGPNVEVVADGSKQVVQVTRPELVPARV